LLFVIILIVNNLSFFLNIDAFFVVLDNRLRFFNNNIRTIIFTRDVEILILNTIIVVLERLIIEEINILCFIL